MSKTMQVMSRVVGRCCCLLTAVVCHAMLAQVELPSGYRALEWISSTGTQYVDTLYKVKSGDTVRAVMEVQFEQPGTTDAKAFGSTPTASPWNNALQMGVRIGATGNYRLWRGTGHSASGKDPGFYGRKIAVEIDSIGFRWKPDGASAWTENFACEPTGDCVQTLFVFAENAINTDGKAPTGYSALRLHSLSITGADGTRMLDLVPCRNVYGEAGLWDLVGGRFLGNKGTGRFAGADFPDMRLSWISSTGHQYIDTLYKVKGYDTVRAVMDVRREQLGTATAFGASPPASPYDNSCTMDVRMPDNGTYRVWRGQADDCHWAGSNSDFYDRKVSVEIDGSGFRWKPVGDVVWTENFSCLAAGDCAQTMFVFAANAATSNGKSPKQYAILKLYSLSVASADETVQCDLVPYRMNGEIGLLNLVTDQFLGKNGSGEFSYGAAYEKIGTVLEVYDGILASDDLFAGCTEVRKAGSVELDATAVTNYPALSLDSGTFTVQNGAIQEYVVAGLLTLKGGVKLRFDVMPQGSDSFRVGSVTLDSSATVENPVGIDIQPSGLTKLETPLVLISCGLESGDLAKFRVASSIPVKLGLGEGGALVLMARDETEAVWTGAAADGGKWSTAHNWQYDVTSLAGLNLIFNISGGGETMMDISEGLAVKNVLVGPEAGAFTHNGGSPLHVAGSLTNLSASAQAFTMPLRLGSLDSAFSINTVGPLTLETILEVASQVTKDGPGVLAAPDRFLYGTQNLVINEGTFKIASRSSVPAMTSVHVEGYGDCSGVIAIKDGARIDVNQVPSNGAPLNETEMTHGKLVFVEGDGPDGAGALYNSQESSNWSGTFGHIVLTGDASVGGNARLDLRDLPGSMMAASAGKVRLEGGYTLTVRNTNTAHNADNQFSMKNTTFALKALRVLGRANLEGTLFGTVTNGIWLADGAYQRFWGGESSSTSVGIPFFVEPNATAQLVFTNGAWTVNGAVTVGERATLAVATPVTATFTGAFTNLGAVVQSGANILYLNGVLGGNGSIVGSKVRFGGTKNRWVMTADDSGFTSKVDVSGVTDVNFATALTAVEVTYTGDTTTPHAFAVCPQGSLTAEYAATIALDVHDEQGNELANCWLGIQDGNLVLHLNDASLVRTAVWTGVVDPSDSANLANSANWICSNDVEMVADGLPTYGTTVIIPSGSVFNVPSGAVLNAKEIVLPASLGGDCDWSGLTLPIDSQIDLRGHSLTLHSFDGSGTITDTDGRGCVPLEWVASTGGQYVDTLYKVKSGDTVRAVMEVQFEQPGTTDAKAFGSTPTSSPWNNALQMGVRIGATGNYRLWRGTGRYAGGKDPGFYGRKIAVEIDAKGFRWKPDGASAWTENFACEPSGDCVQTLFVFAENAINTDGKAPVGYSALRLHSLSITSSDGTPQLDLVPSLRVSDGEVGLWDNVRSIFLQNKTGAPLTAGPAASSQKAGTLRIAVPANETFENRTLNLKGNLKLVKDGAGTFIATKADQSYLGGTHVVAGTMSVPLSGATSTGHSFTGHQLGATGTDVVVESGATFDTKGNYDLYVYDVVLNGGTLANTGCSQNNYGSWGCGGNLTLTSNSFYRVDYLTSHTQGRGRIDLGGHELEVTVARGVCLDLGLPVTNGTLKVCGAGSLRFRSTAEKDMRTVDLVLGTGIGVFDTDISVRNLTTSDYAGAVVGGDKCINIYGTYRPINDYVDNFVLCDGATIDLSARTTVLDLTDKSLSFASDATTLFVALGSSRVSSSQPIITWNDKPANTKFKSAPTERCGYVVEGDGLYVIKGLFILIR